MAKAEEKTPHWTEMSRRELLEALGTQFFVGAAPVFDRFDDLHKLQIEALSGFSSIESEIITTDIYRKLLTDFLMPSCAELTWQS